jgi:histone H3/H4
MAARKKKAGGGGKGGELIISKSRTKAAVKRCNVSGDFYGAFDKAARDLLRGAEERAIANKRKTLRPQDL